LAAPVPQEKGGGTSLFEYALFKIADFQTSAVNAGVQTWFARDLHGRQATG
jgi:hypothetical protein